MSDLHTFLWGAVGGAIYPAISLALAFVAWVDKEVIPSVPRLSWGRIAGFATVVLTQCVYAGGTAVFVLSGLHERRIVIALYVGVGSVALGSAIARMREDAERNAASPAVSETQRHSAPPADGSSASIPDLLRSSLATITSERVTAAAAVATVVIALLAYLTR